LKKILIIDDEPSIQKMLKRLLEKNEYDVIQAANGNEGIKKFKEYTPDLIITDLIMPEKEGLETIRELKKINPDVKVIAISGGGLNDPKMYLDLAAKFGAVKIFSKPVDNDRLLSAIKEVITPEP
jgi:YesN/AraC family two-component response regulator